MASPRLVLIIDKSDAYCHFKRDQTLGAWGIEDDNIQTVTSLDEVGATTLFDDSPTSVMNMEEVDEVKLLVANLEKRLGSPAARAAFLASLEEGLIIMTQVPRTSTKKLEALVTSLGGEVVVPPGKKDAPLVEKLLGELDLTPAVRRFILDYVGSNYEAVLPLVRTLSEIPRAHHRKITEEDIQIRFPGNKGEVPPWELEKHLLAGNMTGTIDTLRRIHRHSHLLVPLSILKNKFQLAYRISALLESGITGEAALAEVLGQPKNYPFTLAVQSAKKYKRAKLERVVLILDRVDRAVKGGSAAPDLAIFEAALVEISLTLR